MKQNKMVQMARQGDVLIIKSDCKSLRKETKKRLINSKKDKTWEFKKENRSPLAYGEVSGHAHAIYESEDVQLNYSEDIQETVKHLDVKKEVQLKHEEHDTVIIPEGKSVVLIQNEYQMGEIRRVLD